MRAFPPVQLPPVVQLECKMKFFFKIETTSTEPLAIEPKLGVNSRRSSGSAIQAFASLRKTVYDNMYVCVHCFFQFQTILFGIRVCLSDSLKQSVSVCLIPPKS